MPIKISIYPEGVQAPVVKYGLDPSGMWSAEVTTFLGDPNITSNLSDAHRALDCFNTNPSQVSLNGEIEEINCIDPAGNISPRPCSEP